MLKTWFHFDANWEKTVIIDNDPEAPSPKGHVY